MTETKTTEVRTCPSCHHDCDTVCEGVIDMTNVPEENIEDTISKTIKSIPQSLPISNTKDDEELEKVVEKVIKKVSMTSEGSGGGDGDGNDSDTSEDSNDDNRSNNGDDSSSGGGKAYRNVVWDFSMEKILSDMGDEAQIYSYLHQKAHAHFQSKNMYFQIPIIVLSAISGSGNFISTNFPDYTKFLIIGIGGLSIFISILSSVAQFLKLSEFSEGHRISYLSWEKFFYDIKFQLRRKRQHREDIKEFLNMIVPEYKRLKEISPDIPKMIRENRDTVKKFKKLNMPFLLNGFDSLQPFITREEYSEDMYDILQDINDSKNAKRTLNYNSLKDISVV
jgi:hypothetical protein